MNNFNFATNEELTEKLDKIFAALPQDEQHAFNTNFFFSIFK